jgi:hypothetical protein
LAGGGAARRDRERFGLAAFQRSEHRIEGAGGGRGCGDVAGAVAGRIAQVHAGSPERGCGLVGAECLDPEHELDFVAGVEGGKGVHGGKHAPRDPAAWFGPVDEGHGPHEGPNGVVDEERVDRAVLMEEGVWIVKVVIVGGVVMVGGVGGHSG